MQSMDDIQSALTVVTLCAEPGVPGRALELLAEIRAWLDRTDPERVVLALASLATHLLAAPVTRDGQEHLRHLALAAGLLREDPATRHP